jgi:uncharacterized protein
MKLLLVLLVIVGAVWWASARQRTRNKSLHKNSHDPLRDAATPVDAAVTAMLVCAQCHVHLPATDAVFDKAGRAYCSLEHCASGPR